MHITRNCGNRLKKSNLMYDERALGEEVYNHVRLMFTTGDEEEHPYERRITAIKQWVDVLQNYAAGGSMGIGENHA